MRTFLRVLIAQFDSIQCVLREFLPSIKNNNPRFDFPLRDGTWYDTEYVKK